MKRIVIACDGTWKRADAEHPTNVVKLAQAVLPAGADGSAQVLPPGRGRDRARHRPAGAEPSTGRSAGRSGRG